MSHFLPIARGRQRKSEAISRQLIAAQLALIAPDSATVHVLDMLNPAPHDPGRAR